ncbi:MAG: endo-arabinase [Saprospiraceae bacterium]|nr:endo-arabinase [Saprospiraceae bacterium]
MKHTFLFIILLTAAMCSTVSTDPVKETEAIKKVLEKESATWRSGDVKAHAECWHIQPYSRILVSLPDGTVIDVPPDAIINPKQDDADLGGTSSNSDYKFSIHGDHAWVSHQEESISKDGNKTYSYEIRILEKIKGDWKLVGQSIMIRKPEQG